MMKIVQQFEVGSRLRFNFLEQDTPVDLAGAGEVYVFIEVSTTDKRRQAFIVGAPTEGVVEYVSVPGDFDALGEFVMKAHVQTSNGKFHLSVLQIQVVGDARPPERILKPASTSLMILSPDIERTTPTGADIILMPTQVISLSPSAARPLASNLSISPSLPPSIDSHQDATISDTRHGAPLASGTDPTS